MNPVITIKNAVVTYALDKADKVKLRKTRLQRGPGGRLQAENHGNHRDCLHHAHLDELTLDTDFVDVVHWNDSPDTNREDVQRVLTEIAHGETTETS